MTASVGLGHHYRQSETPGVNRLLPDERGTEIAMGGDRLRRT